MRLLVRRSAARAGGLGSPAALYLAAAGVGTIGIIEWTSSTLELQRQILHNVERVGMRKVDSAKMSSPDEPGREVSPMTPDSVPTNPGYHRRLHVIVDGTTTSDALPRE